MSKVFYNMAKRNYENGTWNLEMVRNFTALGRITPEEFREITGEEYEEGNSETAGNIGG